MHSETVSKKCPYCGQALHNDSVYCPHCNRSITPRQTPEPPHPFPRKFLYVLIALLVAVAVGVGVYLYTRPKTYDCGEFGELYYTYDDGVTYQLIFGYKDDHFNPIHVAEQKSELDAPYRFPIRMYVHRVDNQANVGAFFLKEVQYIQAYTEITSQKGDKDIQFTTTHPAPHAVDSEAALVSFVDYLGAEFTGNIIWELHMKNGDTLVMRQPMVSQLIQTIDILPQDAPMETIEELQTLVDQIADTIPIETIVNLHLPAVTYTGSLEINGRPINLFGNEKNGQRTTFTDTLKLLSEKEWIIEVDGIDFVGNGTGVGLSAMHRTHIRNCTFSGWKTAVLAYGNSWVNIQSSHFEDNEVAFHFNSTGVTASNTQYPNNEFINNGTAVLLEQVPTDVSISFRNSHFQGNGTDVENLCNHEVDLSGAIIE